MSLYNLSIHCAAVVSDTVNTSDEAKRNDVTLVKNEGVKDTHNDVPRDNKKEVAVVYDKGQVCDNDDKHNTEKSDVAEVDISSSKSIDITEHDDGPHEKNDNEEKHPNKKDHKQINDEFVLPFLSADNAFRLFGNEAGRKQEENFDFQSELMNNPADDDKFDISDEEVFNKQAGKYKAAAPLNCYPVRSRVEMNRRIDRVFSHYTDPLNQAITDELASAEAKIAGIVRNGFILAGAVLRQANQVMLLNISEIIATAMGSQLGAVAKLIEAANKEIASDLALILSLLNQVFTTAITTLSQNTIVAEVAATVRDVTSTGGLLKTLLSGLDIAIQSTNNLFTDSTGKLQAGFNSLGAVFDPVLSTKLKNAIIAGNAKAQYEMTLVIQNTHKQLTEMISVTSRIILLSTETAMGSIGFTIRKMVRALCKEQNTRNIIIHPSPHNALGSNNQCFYGEDARRRDMKSQLLCSTRS